jgi:hypothetical protein
MTWTPGETEMDRDVLDTIERETDEEVRARFLVAGVTG